MGSRLDLQKILESVKGVKKAYFQPPATVQLKYPCIIYELAGDRTQHADNIKYLRKKRYTLMVIDRDPDSEIYERLLDLQFSAFDRFYTADNLNHWIISLYY